MGGEETIIRDYKNGDLCDATCNHLIKLLTEIIWKPNYIPCEFVNQEIKIAKECECVCWLFIASFDKVLQEIGFEKDWLVCKQE